MGLVQDSLIVCENLVKIYKVADLEVFALQGLDLTVTRGELMGIVGVSGSGKSTLLNILGGLDRPSAGRVWVDGADLVKFSDAALDRYRRSQVGFVWQQSARNLIYYLNALQNVELPMTLAGVAGHKARQRAQELVEAVGLIERRQHYLPELSGGEQQRLSIAVALANQPKLLLADEPTGELDSETALSIYETLRTLNRTFGLTTLIVSHDPGLARQVHRVIAIRDGKTAMETLRHQTTAAQTDAHSSHEEAFQELVVLDSAGRLQLPKDYLEQFNIKGRACLEATSEGILIRSAPTHSEQATTIPTAERPPQSRGEFLRRLWLRLRGNGKNGGEP